MTDPEFADATYVEPITPEVVEKIIAKERPDALLPTLGGQTALNCAIALRRARRAREVRRRADRRQHRGDRPRRGPRAVQGRSSSSSAASRPQPSSATRWTSCLAAAEDLGYPVVVRPVASPWAAPAPASPTTRPTCAASAAPACRQPDHRGAPRGVDPRLEGVRARGHARHAPTTCVVVCSIENLDPMGVHTGDSITVAPAHDADRPRVPAACATSRIAIIRAVGVDTGGCNIQFAVNPRRRPR